MTANDIYHLVNTGGTIALLILIVVGGWKRWYVWNSFYDEKRKEADEWKQAALHGTYTAERVASLVTTEPTKVGPGQ